MHMETWWPDSAVWPARLGALLLGEEVVVTVPFWLFNFVECTKHIQNTHKNA